MTCKSTKIITVALNKGGTGKTTTAMALMAGLTKRGKLVLGIDLDSQGNLSVAMGAKRSGKTIYDTLVSGEDICDAIQNVRYGDMVASSPMLSNLDTILSRVTAKEYRLREAISKLTYQYDYIIIDTPPALGAELSNALTASTDVILTAQPNSFSLDGIDMIYRSAIQPVQQYTNKELRIAGILLTRCKKNSNLYKESMDDFREIAEEMGTKLFDTTISDSVKIQEIQSYSLEFFGNSANPALREYDAFVDELEGS